MAIRVGKRPPPCGERLRRGCRGKESKGDIFTPCFWHCWNCYLVPESPTLKTVNIVTAEMLNTTNSRVPRGEGKMATSSKAGTPGRDPRWLIFKANQGDEGYMVFHRCLPPGLSPVQTMGLAGEWGGVFTPVSG